MQVLTGQYMCTQAMHVPTCQPHTCACHQVRPCMHTGVWVLISGCAYVIRKCDRGVLAWHLGLVVASQLQLASRAAVHQLSDVGEHKVGMH